MDSLNTNPLVSIIIPAYNMRKYILEALYSVVAQTYKFWEIIVVDDCSPDPHHDLIDEFKTHHPHALIQIVRHDVNCRLGGARNTGMKMAKGSIFAFLDSDDVWRPDHLADSVSAIAQSADITFCDFQTFTDNVKRSTPAQAFDSWGPFPQSLFVHNFIVPSGVLITRNAASLVGQFSTLPEVHMVEDLDYWIRAASKKLKFTHIPKTNLLYRKHDKAATSNIARILRAKAHVLFNNRSASICTSFTFRRKRISTVCGEAARHTRRKNPLLAVKFYMMSFYVWPLNFKSLGAAIYFTAPALRKLVGNSAYSVA
jgi:teichuronic acid biosynthesis glycosyltransferase TuaG